MLFESSGRLSSSDGSNSDDGGEGIAASLETNNPLEMRKDTSKIKSFQTVNQSGASLNDDRNDSYSLLEPLSNDE